MPGTVRHETGIITVGHSTHTRPRNAGVGELRIESTWACVPHQSVEEVLILEVMVKGDVVDEVTVEEVLTQCHCISTSYMVMGGEGRGAG